MSLTCGIDVGGTKIAGAVVDAAGGVLETLRVESPAKDADAIERAIATLVEDLRSRHPVTAVGVGAAGFVSASRSVVRFAPNLAWRDVDLRADLEEALGLPVVVENDANAAAWGEFRYGAAADVDDSLMVTVGTGVGGGVVIDGRLLRGFSGTAAEIGHLRVVPGGRPCGCGGLGCLEQYGSGTALVHNTRAEAHTPAAAALLERAGGDPEQIVGRMISAAAREGDAFSLRQLEVIGTWLGEAVASLAAVLDPAVVVIGGGVSDAGELLLEPLRAAYLGALPGRGHRPEAEVRRATMGNRAGVVGAADLART